MGSTPSKAAAAAAAAPTAAGAATAPPAAPSAVVDARPAAARAGADVVVVVDVTELSDLPSRAYGIVVPLARQEARYVLYHRQRRAEWTAADFEALGGALRRCGALARLSLMRMNVRDAQLGALLRSLAAPEALEVLELGFCEALVELPDLSPLASLHTLGLYLSLIHI